MRIAIILAKRYGRHLDDRRDLLVMLIQEISPKVEMTAALTTPLLMNFVCKIQRS